MSDHTGIESPRQAGPILQQAAGRLREAGVPDDYAVQMERLAAQVHEPCVIAVVGRVKAGKSTFINALLGEDLAKVGTTETTATINHFRYGQANPERPVRCHWRDGRVTDESRAFLDDLQGNDEATLRRADGVDHLEYRLPNPYLERVTLVDTPGTGAAVEEHQQRTAEFMRLATQLRERHDGETRQLTGEADAVVYLVGPTAGTGDRELLDDFNRVAKGHARPINAIGVLAKIDLDPEVVAQRHDLAARIDAQLKGSLNVVVPVSAGIRRAVDDLLARDGVGLDRLRASIGRIPLDLLTTKLLASEDFWLEWDHADCPLTRDERESLLGDLPWTVFKTIALESASALTDEMALARLDDIAGFEALTEVLERRFLRRGRFLRTYRIVNDARAILDEVRRRHLPTLRRQAGIDHARLDRFVGFIDGASGDKAVAAELVAFVREGLGRTAPDAILDPLDRQLAELFWTLEDHNADHEALQQVEDHPEMFPETGELRSLFGLYDTDATRRLPPDNATAEFAEERQRSWRRVEATARDDTRREVAERAVYRYGKILDALLSGWE